MAVGSSIARHQGTGLCGSIHSRATKSSFVTGRPFREGGCSGNQGSSIGLGWYEFTDSAADLLCDPGNDTWATSTLVKYIKSDAGPKE